MNENDSEDESYEMTLSQNSCKCEMLFLRCSLNSPTASALQTLKVLQQNAKERSEISANVTSSTGASYSIPATSSKMSMQELEELRKKLGNVTSSSSTPQVPDLNERKPPSVLSPR